MVSGFGMGSDLIDTTGWTESKLIKANTHFFQHPDGKDAGPLKWEVQILRKEPTNKDISSNDVTSF